MKNTIRAALVAFGALGALAGTASAQPYDESYYGDQAYGPPPAPYGAQPGYGDPYAYDQAYADFDPTYGYCDPYYGCPDDYYDLPLYYGDVFYDGSWINGPFYYRDYGGRRQFWTHGGWHNGNYRGGRFGPALGRSFYAQRGFSGRSFNRAGNWGGQNYARRAYNGGGNWNGGGFNRGFSGRSSFQAQPQANQNFGFRGRGNYGGWNRQNFQSGGGWQGRSQAQAQVQAQPRQSFQGGGGGGRNWGGGGGGGHSWGGGGGGGHNW